MIKLQVIRGKHKGKSLELAGKGRYSLGRRSCDIDLTDDTVSSRHARLSWDGHGWFVEDLCSTNGTFVNDSRIQHKIPLSQGDRLRLGQAVMEVANVPANGRANGRASPAPVNGSSLTETDEDLETEKLKLKVLIIRGMHQGKTFELEYNHPLPVGRRSKVLPIDDEQVSRRHAVLIPKGGQWHLRDLASRNGTFVNCEPIKGTTPLKEGDLIEIGRTQLQVIAAPVEEDLMLPINGAQETALEELSEHLFLPEMSCPADTAFMLGLPKDTEDDLEKEAKASKPRPLQPKGASTKSTGAEPRVRKTLKGPEPNMGESKNSTNDSTPQTPQKQVPPVAKPVSEPDTKSGEQANEIDAELVELELTEAKPVKAPTKAESPAVEVDTAAPGKTLPIPEEVAKKLNVESVDQFTRNASDLPVTVLPGSEQVSDYLADRLEMLHMFIDRTMSRLTRHDIAVWLVLYRDSNTNNVASTGHTAIAERVGVSASTVNRAIRKLEQFRLLHVVYRGGLKRGTSCYRVHARKQADAV